jgi:hypothetical protein
VSDPLHPRVRELVTYDGLTYVSPDGRRLFRLRNDQDPQLSALRGEAVPGPTRSDQLQNARRAAGARAGPGTRYEAQLNADVTTMAVMRAFASASGQSAAGSVTLVHNRFVVALAGSPPLPARQALREVFRIDLGAAATPTATGAAAPGHQLRVTLTSAGSYRPAATLRMPRPRPVGTVASLSTLEPGSASPPPSASAPAQPQAPLTSACAALLCA